MSTSSCSRSAWGPSYLPRAPTRAKRADNCHLDRSAALSFRTGLRRLRCSRCLTRSTRPTACTSQPFRWTHRPACCCDGIVRSGRQQSSAGSMAKATAPVVRGSKRHNRARRLPTCDPFLQMRRLIRGHDLRRAEMRAGIPAACQANFATGCRAGARRRPRSARPVTIALA
jgi:hypothetical protein